MAWARSSPTALKQPSWTPGKRATDADLQRLDAAYAALTDTYQSDDLAANIDRDVEFHQAIAEATHNVLIGHLTASLLRVIHGHVSGNLAYLHARPAQWRQIMAQHRAIWESIHARDGDAAARAARAHIDFVRESMAETARAADRRESALRRLGAEA